MSLFSNFQQHVAPSMIFVAPLLVYLTARTVLRGMPESLDRPVVRAGLMAFFTLIFSVAGIIAGRIEYAFHLPVAVAVVSMTAGLGSSLLMRTHHAHDHHARRWPLILPVILVLMVCGLAGSIDIVFAFSLLMAGLLALIAFESRDTNLSSSAPVSMAFESSAPNEAISIRGRNDRWRALALIIPSTIGIVIAAILAPEAIARSGIGLKLGSELLASSLLIAPAIVIPLLFESLPHTRKHTLTDEAGALVRLPLLAIGFVIPLTWVAQLITTLLTPPTNLASTQPTTEMIARSTEFALPIVDLPGVILKVDGLMLMAATVLIIPGALGVMRLARTEGACLVVMFVAYLFLSLMAGR